MVHMSSKLGITSGRSNKMALTITRTDCKLYELHFENSKVRKNKIKFNDF